MIDRQDAVKALLAADATLSALLTGGIYTREELGKQGLKQGNAACADAFVIDDGFAVLQPCLVLNARPEVPDGERVDVPSQTISVTTMLECYFYDDDDYTTIVTARNRVYALLMWKTHANIGVSVLDYRMKYYDESLNDAATLKDDYKLRYRRTT